ncbi:MAG TPA: hypothetical protein VGL26_08490 [Jatrophihabitans sp.]|jgi:predicted transcriptional regulator
MKRITVSLPDALVDRVKQAAGGERQVSAYVARALEQYEDQESLDDILADWNRDTPVSDKAREQVEAEFRAAGLLRPSAGS